MARETLPGFPRSGRDWAPLRELVARWDADVVAAGLTGWDGTADLGVPMIVSNDAVTAHLGALGGEPGAVIVAGTGAIALAASRERWARADGWGPLLGDDGGGFWIARRALARVLREHDGRAGVASGGDAGGGASRGGEVRGGVGGDVRGGAAASGGDVRGGAARGEARGGVAGRGGEARGGVGGDVRGGAAASEGGVRGGAARGEARGGVAGRGGEARGGAARGGDVAGLRAAAEARFGPPATIARAVYDAPDPVATVAAFARDVIDLARGGDAAAVAILAAAGEELARTTTAALVRAGLVAPGEAGAGADAPRGRDAAPHDAAPHDAAPHDAAPHDAAPHEASVTKRPDTGPFVAPGAVVSWAGGVFAAGELILGPLRAHLPPSVELRAPLGDGLAGAARLLDRPALFSGLIQGP